MDNNELISKAINFAKNNLENHELSVRNIADAAGFSLDYFNRMFFTYTGFTVMAYVSYMRLRRARLLLRESDKSIMDIAFDVGYDSHEGFSKAFCKRYGIMPNEYRKQAINQVITYGEFTDPSVAYRFIHDNPDFMIVDANEVIDYLIEKDLKKYAWICSEIKAMNLQIVAQNGEYKHGFIGIGDDLKGGRYLEIVSEDKQLIDEWLKKFNGRISVYGINLLECLKERYRDIECQNIAVYTGVCHEYNLPNSINVRKLSADDFEKIRAWAGNRNDAYIMHLLNERHYSDSAVLEYGVFENDDLIAIAGCGLDEIGDTVINDCCIIRFAEGRGNDALYRSVYCAVTEDIWQNGIIPYDTIQFGEYAKTHGDFFSTDIGFQIMIQKYIIR